MLDRDVNPMVEAHGGRIELVDRDDGVVSVRMTGRCQGCAMAQVTIRQGVEALMTRQVPGVARVVDVTDHTGGADPYYPTRKR
ncbi:MAG: NifU family protein [Acidimicrobiales bacterium]